MTEKLEVWMGADPGMSGAIAVVHYPLFARAFALRDLDESGIDILLDKIVEEFDVLFCLIEQVQIIPGDENKRRAITKLLVSFGQLRMAIIGHKIRLLDPITPRSWQSQMGCPNRRGDKGISHSRAKELFPNIRVTLQTADALLLARLCQWNAPTTDLVAEKKSWRNFYDDDKTFRREQRRQKKEFLRRTRSLSDSPRQVKGGS